MPGLAAASLIEGLHVEALQGSLLAVLVETLHIDVILRVRGEVLPRLRYLRLTLRAPCYDHVAVGVEAHHSMPLVELLLERALVEQHAIVTLHIGIGRESEGSGGGGDFLGSHRHLRVANEGRRREALHSHTNQAEQG